MHPLIIDMAEEDFPEWLKSLEKKFCNLSSARQTETLNQLIATCGSDQLWLLQQRLPELLYRDFVRWLDLLFMEIIQTLIVENSSLLLCCCCIKKMEVSFLLPVANLQ